MIKAGILSRVMRDLGGGAILEFAIVGPVLLSMILGVIELGRMFYVRHGLEYATEQAARYYMMNPNANTSTVTSYLQSQMPGGMGGAVNVSYADTANCNSNASLTCTMISATYSFTSVAGYLGLGTRNLLARAQAVRWL